MSAFGLSALLLILFAAALVLIPWRLAGNKQSNDTLSNTRIVRQRLQELERECAEGLISEEDKTQAIDELKLALVDEDTKTGAQQSVPKLLVSLVMLLTLLFSSVVYWQANQLGQLSELNQALARLPELSQRIVMQGDPDITSDDIRGFALGLRTRLQEEPGDATSWMLLGRLHIALRQLEPALQAFAHSEELDPENLSNLTSYSQALLTTGQRASMQQAQVLLQRILRLSPEDDNAVLMLTLVAAELGNLELARTHFAVLQKTLAETDPIYQSLSKKLMRSETVAEDSTEIVEPELVSGGQTTGFVINVLLDEGLRDKLPEQGYLFVFAQDASGASRMPAAVVRQPLSALPLTITLTDANAMMPDYKLSQLKNTRLVARISRDSNVTKSAGELQGETIARVQQGISSNQNITINKEIL